MKLAYLLNTYPLISTTFIRREIQAIEALGQPVDVLFPDALPQVPVEPQAKAKNGKVVGKRTGKVLATKQDVTDEISAVLAG